MSIQPVNKAAEHLINSTPVFEQKKRETDRQTDRQTEKETETETDRQTETERDREQLSYRDCCEDNEQL